MTAPTSPTPGHEKYADWDGAYVLGALSAAERAEFEKHLAGCSVCASAVAELAALPGLLGRVAAEERAALLEDQTAGEVPAMPADLEGRILASARAEWGGPPVHRLRTRTRVALVVAAAVVVVAGVAVPVIRHDDRPSGESVTLRAATASPLSAEVTLTATDWGTRIEMTCTYAGRPGAGWGSQAYGLYVIDDSGQAHVVSSWHAGPGDTARTTGSTDLAVDRLSSVELRAADGTTVLLSATV